MKSLKPILVISALVNGANIIADENYDHFPSLEAPNLTIALCNLGSFNQQLADITSKPELTATDMVKIHELTYTLENAIARIREELTATAADLEKVHKASERLDGKTIATTGEKYLATTNQILRGTSCD